MTEHRAISSFGEIFGWTVTGTLALFFIAEIMLGQDVFFVHPVLVLAISSIAAMFWYRGQDHRVS